MYIIAGVDPGKTCGLACLDLDGKLVFRSHMTFGGSEWLINELNSIGTPVIIASDKQAAGSIVKKIGSAFNSRLFCPKKNLSIEEKRNAAKMLGIKNPHERDAYTAAITAYRAYYNKFKQAERIAGKVDKKYIDGIKAKVVARYSIKEAMECRKANR